MDTIKRNKLLQALSLVLLIGLLWCCSDESAHDIPTIVGEHNTITFSVKVPSAGTPKSTGPKTYALAEADENEVSQIAVLLFDSDDNYIHQPIYCGGNSITSDPGNSQVKTFTIKVPEGTYDMVVLANSNQSLNDALSTISTGQPKATVLNKLLISNSGKWNATPGSSNYMAIPMWGEAMDVLVREGMSAKTSVTLVRMVAKIDVALTSSAAREKFNLQSVRLYNYNNQGQIVPDVSNWDINGSVVTAPSVPSSANRLATPLLFNGSAITSDASSRGVSCINEIYTFEAPIGTSSSIATNSCIVVGGIFDGDSQTTYYRIDMANTTGVGEGATITYFPLLRNHNYKVNIAEVKASGLVTPEAAFNAAPANIEASIINWNDAQITEIVFDGQYMLGLSQGEFTFSREERNSSGIDNTLFVTTDYPSGWKLNKIVDDANNTITWMSLSTSTGAAGATKTAKLILSENTTGSIREGFVYLSAGRLTYIIKVKQIAKTKDISITDMNDIAISKLEFVAAKDVQPAQQHFKLSWPDVYSLSYLNTSTENVFLFDTGAGCDNIPINGAISNSLGLKTFTICPPSITTAELASDPFYERSSIISYFIPDGESFIIKKLTLRQFAYNMVPVVNNVYLMDGSEKSFGVRSNTPFKVSVKNNPDNVITLKTTSGGANTSTSGTLIYFDIIDDLTNPTFFQKNVVITISSPTNRFTPTDVTLNCISTPPIIEPESNSYIVAPNSATIRIPVSRANKSMLGGQLSDGEAFTAELIWTDNSNKLSANSNIKRIDVEGTGPSAYLVVEPGSAKGNAVVAIKDSANKILWSWHIWVTGYVPEPVGDKKFMDRNLGAISNQSGAVGAKGLLYQWGRKDPFPGSTTINGDTEPTLYTSTGNTSIAKTAVSELSNFVNSVAYPKTFYYNSSSPSDWYTNSASAQNNNLWNDSNNKKTIYDPCPHGWRVPQNEAWTDIPTPASLTNNGYNFTNYGGFYPGAGRRNYDSGEFSHVGTKGYYGFYWSATSKRLNVNDDYSYYLYFDRGFISPGGSLYRAYGFSVRCVQE